MCLVVADYSGGHGLLQLVSVDHASSVCRCRQLSSVQTMSYVTLSSAKTIVAPYIPIINYVKIRVFVSIVQLYNMFNTYGTTSLCFQRSGLLLW